MAAMVATQAAAALMADQARIATFAQRGPAAVVAQHDGRVATSIDEQQNLLAGFQMLADLGNQRIRQSIRAALSTQVDDLHVRCFGLTKAGVQGQVVVTAGKRVVMAFQRRCCRTQHHRNAYCWARRTARSRAW